MVTTEERKATEAVMERPPRRRRSIVISLLILAAIAAAVVNALLAGGGNDGAEALTSPIDEPAAAPAQPGSPDWVMEELVAAVKPLDPAGFEGLSAPLDPAGSSFLEWNLALGMDPVFTDCGATPSASSTSVTCSVAMGEDYFFSRVEGNNVSTKVYGTISNSTGELTVTGWPPPQGLVATETAFREWIRANHPAEEAKMFGNDFAGIVRFSQEAGELHTQFADEYLASLS